MELNDFLFRVDLALKMLYKFDGKLLDLNVNERSIAHRFANYLEPMFKEYDVDCEYDRYGERLLTEESNLKLLPEIHGCIGANGPKKSDWVIPDILIHKRASRDENNLAVFEIKTKGSLDDCDVKKLTGLTKKNGLFKYDFGMGIEFLEPQQPLHLELFLDGQNRSDLLPGS